MVEFSYDEYYGNQSMDEEAADSFDLYVLKQLMINIFKMLWMKLGCSSDEG